MRTPSGWQIANALWQLHVDQDRRALGRRGGAARRAPSGCSSSAGHAGITTRRLAEEAGVNHGLVHYYFGSNENLLARALERFTERLIERQRALYAADVPFIEKWRTAMRYLIADDVDLREDLARAAGAGLERPGAARAARARERASGARC